MCGHFLMLKRQIFGFFFPGRKPIKFRAIFLSFEQGVFSLLPYLRQLLTSREKRFIFSILEMKKIWWNIKNHFCKKKKTGKQIYCIFPCLYSFSNICKTTTAKKRTSTKIWGTSCGAFIFTHHDWLNMCCLSLIFPVGIFHLSSYFFSKLKKKKIWATVRRKEGKKLNLAQKIYI